MSERIHGTIIGETQKAYHINVDGDEQWVPKSVITSMLKEPEDSRGHRDCEFVMESWKAKQLGWD